MRREEENFRKNIARMKSGVFMIRPNCRYFFHQQLDVDILAPRSPLFIISFRVNISHRSLSSFLIRNKPPIGIVPHQDKQAFQALH